MKRGITIALVAIFLTVSTLILLTVLFAKEEVPGEIKKQVQATILIPKSDDITVNKDSYKFNPSQKLLSYTAVFQNITLTITQQPTPESFIDIPQAYDSLVNQMGQYAKLETDVGTTYLTRPKGQPNVQIAVLNTKGTLTFVKSESNISNEQWRAFFSSFEVVK